jgi:hypothetical protein
MVDLAVLAALLVIALGVGRRLLRAVPFEGGLEEGLFATALGLGLLAYATLALGLTGLLGRPALVALLTAAAALTWREIVAMLAGALQGVRRWRDVPPSRSETLGLVLGTTLVAAEIVMVFAPPVGGDQTKYQLVYPRLWAEAHRLVATPWSFWGYLQYLMNMLFTAAFVLRGDVLARLLNDAFGVLLAFTVFALGRRVFSRQTGVWAALLFVTMPLTATLMIRAWVEFTLTAYAVLAVIALLGWRRSGARTWLALAAVMAGFAAGTKLIGLLVPALIGLAVLAHVVRRGGAAALGAGLTTLVAFGLVAAVVASPCYLRNAIDTHNPVFPFGYGVFGGRNWSADAAKGLDTYYDAYRETQAARRGGHAYRSLWQTLRFPWDATMAPQSFEEVGRSAYDLGPFLLAFAPGLLLLRRSPQAWLLAGLAVAYAAPVALFMWAHPRYVHPAVPLLLVVAVEAVRQLGAFGAGAARAVTAILTVTVLAQAGLAVRVLRPLWPDSARVAAGRMSRDQFLRRNEKCYALAALVDAKVPRDANVLVLGMIPHPYYYLDRHFTLASPLEQDAIDYRKITTLDEFIAALQQYGVTHVVREAEVEKRAANPVGERVVRLWDELVAHADKLGETPDGALYRLSPALARTDGRA